MEVIITITVGFIAAGLGPVAVIITNKWIEEVKRKRALGRIDNEPLYKEGAIIRELRLEGSDVPLMLDCKITSIAKGRIEIRDDTGVISFTGREFEKLHPIFQIEG